MNPIIALKELQEIEVNILKGFIEFCDGHDLKYFVVYGTLLGTIRHNGIIPWDDDIDVCMPRQDYQKFICLTEKNGVNRFIKIDNPLYNHDSSSLIVRAYDNRTKITSGDFNIGIFVDIHPLDMFPENFIIRKLWFTWIWIHKKGMLLSRTKVKSSSVLKFFFKLMLLPIIIVAKIIGFRYFKNMVINSAQYYSLNNGNSEYLGIILADWPLGKLALNRTDFTIDEFHLFEEVEVRIPRNYESLLNLWYGDYLVLPLEAEQKPKHKFVAFWK
ncbi:LicD family protein [Phascolarctobacterium sp.]|uniref:LicD family protein n=1 Tax=Phascolarctobacterium sp. TaxID=2049039 RepID=UPI0030779A6A